jgi:DNA-binding CsgD family transcriptional regulator/PAS domain-containing protein
MQRRHSLLDDSLSDLIGHLYDAAVDSRLWSGIAPKIAHAFDSTSTVLKLHNGPSVQLLECTDNMLVPDSQREWAEHWHQRDLWVERTVAFGLSTIVTDRDLVTRQEQRDSGFYREWLPTMDIFHVVGAAFPVGESAVGVLGIHRPEGARHYGKADRQRAGLFLPHLRRALQLGQSLSCVRHAAALDVLDRLDAGVLVVTRSCRILHANAVAEDMLRTTSEFGVLGGRLFLRDGLLHERFARLVRSCVQTAAGQPERPETALAIPRAERLPLTLGVAPLRPTDVLAVNRPLALVFLRDPEYAAPDTSCLRDLFNLTATEAAVAADLGRGRSPEAIARERHIGLATVRSHLKQILAKTGTNRQAEAAALIARSIASLRIGSSPSSPK